MALVCHCEVVNDRGIKRAIKDGAGTVDEVGDKTGAGTGCGGCVPTIEVLLKRWASFNPDLDLAGDNEDAVGL